MKKLGLALIASLFVASAGTASAQEIRINISDLDLSTRQGAETFDARLQSQARLICTGTGSRLPSGLCLKNIRNEVLSLLPAQQRQDYARARNGPVTARTPATQD